MMMQDERQPSLDDVLNEFVAECEQPTAEALEALAGRHPQFRRELIEFAAAWVEQMMLPPSPEPTAEEDKSAVDRAMSHVQNVSYGRDQLQETGKHAIRSLIAEAKSTGLSAPDFAKACSLDLVLITKLNNRQIIPGSIPARLISHMARLLGGMVTDLADYFASPPQAMAGRAFLAHGKPQSMEQQSFADAVRASSLTEAEKARWLDEASRLDER